MIKDEILWKDASECFTSIPANDPTRRELWFTDNHTHDIGSIENGKNIMVNMDRRVVDERGTKYVGIHPMNYEGCGPMKI